MGCGWYIGRFASCFRRSSIHVITTTAAVITDITACTHSITVRHQRLESHAIHIATAQIMSTKKTPNNALQPTAAAPATSNVHGLIMAASLRSTVTPSGCA